MTKNFVKIYAFIYSCVPSSILDIDDLIIYELKKTWSSILSIMKWEVK